MSKFCVTLNYNCNYGFVEYDSESKTAAVTLPVEEAKKKVEAYLTAQHTFDVPEGAAIRNFVTRTFNPLADVESFKTCMTRLWVNTGVRVEWSMPPGMAEHL